MTSNPYVLFLLGGVLLIVGSELLVRGASRLAVAVGISPLVVGLTVVAFGTSAPEMAVTVGSAYAGQAEVALGNVVGSNIFNVLFILGVSALIAPLVVAQQLVRFDVPLMIGISIATLLLALDGNLGRLDGAVLFAGIIAYTIFLIRQSRRETAAIEQEYAHAFDKPAKRTRPVINVALILAGLGLLVVGSQWLVDAAVTTASELGVSELVIGLTIVAVGTSLPEVATSVTATIRGERDIAVGNVIGSNIFNILAVLGLGSLVAPDGIPVPDGALSFDIPIMIGVAIACLPIFFTGYAIARWEAAVFLGYYLAYIAYLVVDASGHGLANHLAAAITWFVLPLTVLTVAITVIRHRRADRTITR
ncbi:MAG: calcium/sodium antiporter [Actinobacteria bacterium]|jgi:cation:H+ antiporter|nr:calcium/sodium antiporter [Actinomycetota bacterium]